ncbi:MAG: replication protein [Woeseiaceae bacterium]
MSLLKQNFFPFPNVFADELMAHLTPTQFKCLVAIIRKTLGWHKPSDAIALSQFMDLTGIRSKTTVMRALRVLEGVDLVAVQRTERITSVYTLGPIFYNNKCTSKAITKIVTDLVAQNTPDRTISISSIAPTIDSSLNIKERENDADSVEVKKGSKEKRADGAQGKDSRQETVHRSTDGINPQMEEIFKELAQACKP